MNKNLIKKCLAFAIIFLLICLSVIQSTGEKIVNKCNIALYSENSTICGFITDFETGEPIFDASVRFFIKDLQGNYDDYEVFSDENGFYIIGNVDPGEIFDYGAVAGGYHMFFGGSGLEIYENETLWVNMSLYPLQPETSKVQGYVYDNYTGEPISNVSVTVHWFDIHHQLNYRGDDSDKNGFYSVSIGAGSFDIYTDTEGYINYWLGRFNISDYETKWVNFSLDPEIIIEIKSPLNGVYYKNKMLLPFYFPLIIGPVDIKINVTLYEGDPIDNVEIIIDNVSKKTFTSEPYIYNWSEKTLLKFRHTIEIIAHRTYDPSASMNLSVWKFF